MKDYEYMTIFWGLTIVITAYFFPQLNFISFGFGMVAGTLIAPIIYRRRNWVIKKTT